MPDNPKFTKGPSASPSPSAAPAPRAASSSPRTTSPPVPAVKPAPPAATTADIHDQLILLNAQTIELSRNIKAVEFRATEVLTALQPAADVVARSYLLKRSTSAIAVGIMCGAILSLFVAAFGTFLIGGILVDQVEQYRLTHPHR